ncbi:unnamed protein product [Albugo candida]|uniref:Uncharacterized protein n=1 Tax=Albugo candida TaxID=65357 RepID=A0A024GQN2_9STRA|nr:unnamed protein product [Albugo candida]|eukprot:CCI49091.1 unnamed protein product [Albugo candida]
MVRLSLNQASGLFSWLKCPKYLSSCCSIVSRSRSALLPCVEMGPCTPSPIPVACHKDDAGAEVSDRNSLAPSKLHFLISLYDFLCSFMDDFSSCLQLDLQRCR